MRCTSASIVLPRPLSTYPINSTIDARANVDGQTFLLTLPKTAPGVLGNPKKIGSVIDFKKRFLFIGGDQFEDCWVH